MAQNIVIPNQEKLGAVKEKIAEKGAAFLHILADFDRTLTKAFVDGQETPSILSILRNGKYLTPDYAGKAQALFDKYHPTEIDPQIPLEGKKKVMEEWWRVHFQLMIKSGLRKKDVESIVNSEKIRLREGAKEFFDLLKDFNIPLVIISASGLGWEAISMILKREEKFYDNIHIISNAFEWDEKGAAISVKEPIIHSMNKDEVMVRDFPRVFEAIKNRKNVILLGDNLEDVEMITGFDYESLLKIGFLNKNVKENLKNYSNVFDVVITDDSDMYYVNSLVKELGR